MISQLTLAAHLLFLSPADTNWPKKQLILGHRGARAVAPENTIASFTKAMQMGAEGIELDVFLSRDKVPVVLHDDTLDRTTNGTGIVWEKDAAELVDYVPTLLETLRALPDGAVINIELKGEGRYSKQEFVDVILETIADFRHKLFVIISSFDPQLLELMRKKDLEICIGLLLDDRDVSFGDALYRMKAIRPDALHMMPRFAKPWLVRLAQSKGLHVMLWTINDQKVAKERLNAGVDGIFSDLPEGFIWTDSKR